MLGILNPLQTYCTNLLDSKFGWPAAAHWRWEEAGLEDIPSAAFLNYHRNVSVESWIVDETIYTLALLFPTHDQDSTKWVEKQQSKLRVDPVAMKCDQLKLEERQIDHFNFWHDWLVVLKQFLDDSPWSWVAILLVIGPLLIGSPPVHWRWLASLL